MDRTTQFINKYANKTLNDDGSVLSPEFKKFAADFRSTVKSIAGEIGANLKVFRVGHYDMSGFIEKDCQYVYFSYGPTRNMPIDPWACDPMNGILVRTAANLKDYRGGHNHFTNIEDFRDTIEDLLSCEPRF